MSCNGCRVLRRGCGENCPLRPCLDWIESPQAQANATTFVSKFFGRSNLISFISAVPENKRPALFQSLLFEACGRTVNPVGGAVGLLSTGNWHICQAAVDTVFSGGKIYPLAVGIPATGGEGLRAPARQKAAAMHGGAEVISGEYFQSPAAGRWGCVENSMLLGSGLWEMSQGFCGSNGEENGDKRNGGRRPKLLNFFP